MEQPKGQSCDSKNKFQGLIDRKVDSTTGIGTVTIDTDAKSLYPNRSFDLLCFNQPFF